VIYFIAVYIGIGILAQYGWNNALIMFKEGPIMSVLNVVLWPTFFIHNDSMDYVFLGWSGDPERYVREYIDGKYLMRRE